jgi:hypothetical protein
MGAAEMVASSSGDSIRNRKTLELFKGFPNNPGQPTPILMYF